MCLLFFQRVVYTVGFNLTLKKFFLDSLPNEIISHSDESAHSASSSATRPALAGGPWREHVCRMDWSTQPGRRKVTSCLENRNLLSETMVQPKALSALGGRS